MNVNLRAGAIMLVAVASFSLMDAGLKVLSPSYPPLQVAALRAFASLPLIVLWVGITTRFREILRIRFGLHALRAVLGIIMLASFVFGVRRLPLSEAYAIFFVAPLLITTLAALILRERIEWQRWAAIAVGLCGVVVVLNPTGVGLLTAGGMAVLLCAVCYAMSAIAVRILGRTESTESMVFWLMTLTGAGAALLASPEWRPIHPQHWLVICGIGLAGGLGQWAITEAFRVGEASFIAPFEYTALVWGMTLDWTLWRTLPNPRALAGAAVIIASGLFLIHRERVTGPARN